MEPAFHLQVSAGEQWLGEGAKGDWGCQKGTAASLKSSEESYRIDSLLALYFYDHALVLGNAISKCLI